ncbi:MAG: hypothetical protein ABEK16_01105 [Candidatus Nanohalobium sp.]
MANEVYNFGFKGIKALDDGSYQCTKCRKKFDTQAKVKRHYSTLHKDENRNLAPGQVSEAVASKSKHLKDVAERLEVNEGRLYSFIQSSQHFYLKEGPGNSQPRIGEML